MQVSSVKALSKPAVDFCQELVGLSALTLLLPQPCQACGGVQFQGFGLLVVGDVESTKGVSSHTTVAKQLDKLASIDGLKGVMCIFDDFEAGTEDFGRKHTSARHAGMLLLCDTQLPLQRVQEDRATGLAGWCIFVGPR